MRSCQRTINTWKKTIVFWGIFPTQEFNPYLLRLLHWQAGSLPLESPGKPNVYHYFLSWGEKSHQFNGYKMVVLIWFFWQLLPEVGGGGSKLLHSVLLCHVRISCNHLGELRRGDLIAGGERDLETTVFTVQIELRKTMVLI